MPTTDEFRSGLLAELMEAQRRGAPAIEVNAGELHRKMGGYPPIDGGRHQMPSCCGAMYAEQQEGDEIVSKPPKGKGATLTIRYRVPR